MDTSVRRATHHGVPVLHVTGDLDLEGVTRVRDELAIVLQSSEHRAVVVDLTPVGLIDSAGLGVLVDAHKRLQERGGALRLVVHQEAVLRVLRISALMRLLDVSSDLEGALLLAGKGAGRVPVPR